MPIYEYCCESCGVELEKLQRMSDPALTDCPECGKASLRKMVSASSFRLKGTGWYETDFKTGKKKNGVADSKAGAASSSDKSDSSSASKPASQSKSDSSGSAQSKKTSASS